MFCVIIYRFEKFWKPDSTLSFLPSKETVSEVSLPNCCCQVPICCQCPVSFSQFYQFFGIASLKALTCQIIPNQTRPLPRFPLNSTSATTETLCIFHYSQCPHLFKYRLPFIPGGDAFFSQNLIPNCMCGFTS